MTRISARRHTSALAAAWLASAFAASAHADEPARGTILRIEESRALVDLGRKDGVRPEQAVRVLKRYVLSHPVTGAKIEDELFLGEAKIAEVGARITAVELGAIRKASVGDVVTLARAPDAMAAVLPAPSVACKPCEKNEAALAAHAAFLAAVGRDADGRRKIWRRYLDGHPESPYREQVVKELRFLSSLDAAPTPPEAIDPGHNADTSAQRLSKGEAYALAVILPTGLQRHLRGVYAFHRRSGEKLYQRLAMSADGDGYWRVTIPGAAVGVPGLQLFVEAIDAAGRRARVLADADRPFALEVRAPVVKPDERRGRSRFEMHYDYVNYYLTEASRDTYWKLDAAFTYKVDLGILSHFKLGFGFFQGTGGERTVVEGGGGRGLDALSFGYVYLQPELELHELFAILPRLTVGQIDKQSLAGFDSGRRTDQLFGGHVFMRIGKREGTHLLLGAGSTQQTGFETQITMNLGLWARTPVAFSAIVSNVPVARDLGLLLRGSVGQRIGDFMEIGMHLGFAVRNIDHTGIDFGSFVAFNW